MAANKYKVPQKQWRKWRGKAQEVFNILYDQYKNGGLAVCIPGAEENLTAKGRTVGAWNMAWLAADAVKEANV